MAGTNGKGSVVALLAAALRWRGHRVATYTSPHLVDFRERIVADGRPIPEDDVVRFLEEHAALIERLDATFFEVTTALAFDWLARQAVDVAVIEVGLGGRLDSTNVVRHPLAAGVVTVGVEHTEYLGASLEGIAREKAAIYKRGVPAVYGPLAPVAERAVVEAAQDVGATPIVAATELVRPRDVRLTGTGTTFLAGDGVEVRTPLRGEHQAANTAVALAMLSVAGERWQVPLERASDALADVRLPGRFQRHGRWIFDVAHNPDGAAVLARTLAAVAPPRPLVAVVAILGDKDWRGMLSALAPQVDRLVLTSAPSAPVGRLWDAAAAARWLRELGTAAEHVADLDEALRVAEAEGATIVVTGSFHTVGDAMVRLQVDPLAR